MLREKIGWSNPQLLLGDLWTLGTARLEKERHVECDGGGEGELFINIWESILARNKIAQSITGWYSPPFHSVNVELHKHAVLPEWKAFDVILE